MSPITMAPRQRVDVFMTHDADHKPQAEHWGQGTGVETSDGLLEVELDRSIMYVPAGNAASEEIRSITFVVDTRAALKYPKVHFRPAKEFVPDNPGAIWLSDIVQVLDTKGGLVCYGVMRDGPPTSGQRSVWVRWDFQGLAMFGPSIRGTWFDTITGQAEDSSGLRIAPLPHRDTPSHTNGSPVGSEAGAIRAEREAVYGKGHYNHGDVMYGIFPQGLKLDGPEDFTRFTMFNNIVQKLVRYGMNFKNGGHRDSSLDLGNYGHLLTELDDEIRTRNGR